MNQLPLFLLLLRARLFRSSCARSFWPRAYVFRSRSPQSGLFALLDEGSAAAAAAAAAPVARASSARATALSVSSTSSGGGGGSGARRAPTVAGAFVAQMRALAATLEATSCSFVRCVKPNRSMELGVFDRAHVAEQLRAQGVLLTCVVSLSPSLSPSLSLSLSFSTL